MKARAAANDLKLARVFHLSVYALACLSGGILTWAEGRALPGALTFPIALAALILNEELQLVRLTGLWANVLALLAFVSPAFEFFGDNPEGRLLAGAHLLIYLQWILLIQEKEGEQYWWIVALSVLQVAVAAVLTTSGWFGVFVSMYLLLAMWTLSVFSLYLAEVQFSQSEWQAQLQPDAIPLRHAGSLLPASTAISAGIAARRTPASTVRNSVQHDPSQSWINTRFVLGVAAMTAASMVLGLLFFLLTPRIWVGGLNPFANSIDGGGRALSGFAERIQLGDMGEILESSAPVLQVRVFDTKTQKQMDVAAYAAQLGFDEPLFRGTVLSEYRQGRWQPSEGPSQIHLLSRDSPMGIVRQEYLLQPIGTKVLFALSPYTSGRMDGRFGEIRRHAENSMLVRTGRPVRQAMEYIIHSPGRAPPDAGPVPRAVFSSSQLGPSTRQRYLQLPEEGIERIAPLVETITAPGRAAAAAGSPSDLETARAIVSWLRDSGQFSYTLDVSVQDPSIDPVEDFLFNRKAGHCEYFASALVLMLRTAGIPARLVSGFKGGIDTPGRGYWEVQQRHAHAWSEAFIDGNWIVLDATPADDRNALVEEAGTKLGLWERMRVFFGSFWIDYVVNMSRDRQQDSLYEPLWNAWAELRDAFTEQGLNSYIAEWLRKLATSPERWISWQGGVTAFVLMLLVLAGVRLVQMLLRLSKRLRARSEAARSEARIRVEFYEAFERVLAAAGLTRRSNETQREFAATIRDQLRDRVSRESLDPLTQDVAEAFYRVRFGAAPLEETEYKRLRGLIDNLEEALTAPATGASHGNGSQRR